MEGAEIRKRFDALESLRKTLDDTYQTIERYVVPYRGEFFKPLATEGEVEWRRRRIFDSTAVISNNLLAAQMHSNLTSPSVQWFNFTFRDHELNSNREASHWLDLVSIEIWQELLTSNFNMEISESYMDLTSFGTCCLFEEEKDEMQWKGLEFTALPLRDCYFEPDADGNVKKLYRRLQFTRLQMEDFFGFTPDCCKDDESIDRKWTVVFCIYPRKDKKDADIMLPIAPENRPFGYKYILHDDASTLKSGGYYEMPGFMARWQKISGSRWGFSPAFQMLSDILQLNEVVAQTSEARAKVIDPPMKATARGVLGDVDLGPGGLTVVQDLNAIEPLDQGFRFDQADAEIERLQQSIRAGFYIDKLELKESPAMTATEVSVRYERMQRQFAPTLGRLQADLFDPLLYKTYTTMARAGQLPEMPEVVVGKEMDIEYTGPIPRAQKNEVATGIETWIGGLAGLAQVMPEIMDGPDPDKISERLAELRGVPLDLIKPNKQIKAERTARAQQQKELQEAEAFNKAATGVAALGGPQTQQ